MKHLVYLYVMVISALFTVGCHQREAEKEKAYNNYIRPIPGDDEPISAKSIQRGKVLIAYADCYTCHKEDERSFGPAFGDVAKRYPANKVFTQMLAQKIIMGGKGSWGNAVMLSHPKLSVKDAEDMAAYVLSLEE